MPDKSEQAKIQDRRTFLKRASLLPAALYLDGCAVDDGSTGATDHPAANGQSMIDYVAPPLDNLHIDIQPHGQLLCYF